MMMVICVFFSNSSVFSSDSWFFFHLLAICWNSPLTRSARIWTKEMLIWYPGKYRYTNRKIQMLKRECKFKNKEIPCTQTAKYRHTNREIQIQKQGNTFSKTEEYRYTKREAQTLHDKVSKDLDKSSWLQMFWMAMHAYNQNIYNILSIKSISNNTPPVTWRWPRQNDHNCDDDVYDDQC